jgi:hypothetical protein
MTSFTEWFESKLQPALCHEGWPVASVDNDQTAAGGSIDPMPATPIHAVTHQGM